MLRALTKKRLTSYLQCNRELFGSFKSSFSSLSTPNLRLPLDDGAGEDDNDRCSWSVSSSMISSRSELDIDMILRLVRFHKL